MKDSLMKEDFYKKLDPKIQEKTYTLLKAAKIKNISQKISTFIYCIIGLLFIYFSRNAFFNPKYFSSINNIFNFAKLLTIMGGTILITGYITKTPKENYDKALTSLRNQFLLKICDCKLNCRCKNELNNYLGKQGINIIK